MNSGVQGCAPYVRLFSALTISKNVKVFVYSVFGKYCTKAHTVFIATALSAGFFTEKTMFTEGESWLLGVWKMCFGGILLINFPILRKKNLSPYMLYIGCILSNCLYRLCLRFLLPTFREVWRGQILV